MFLVRDNLSFIQLSAMSLLAVIYIAPKYEPLDFFVTESGGKFESIISTPECGKITPSNYNLHDLHSGVKVPSIN